MAKKEKSPDQPAKGIKRIIEAYRLTREQDPKVGLVCGAWLLGVGIVVGVVIGVLLNFIAGIVLGIGSGTLAWLFIFGRRAERAAYSRVAGRPGGAGAALGVLRRGWQVQQAVAVTKNQDLVHRVVGRPGVILVGEGNVGRVRSLLGVEKRRHARVVGDTPIYDVIVAEDGSPDTVPVSKLAKHLTKLPKSIAPADITDLMSRLRALDATRPQLPVPKGPMPGSLKQARSQARQSMRGR